MKIETNPFIFKEPKDFALYSNTETLTTSAVGFHSDNNIYLIPRPWISILGTYCHEVGHIKGNLHSFVDGLILTPSECKKTTVPLSQKEKSYIRNQRRLGEPDVEMNDILGNLADKILSTFLNGNFNPQNVYLYNVSPEKMKKIVGKNFSAPNTKRTRNVELSAYITQVGCLQILENTLKKNNLIEGQKHLFFSQSKSPGHQRAINIVARAYRKTDIDWNIPSYADLIGKKLTMIDQGW